MHGCNIVLNLNKIMFWVIFFIVGICLFMLILKVYLAQENWEHSEAFGHRPLTMGKAVLMDHDKKFPSGVCLMYDPSDTLF